MKILKLVILVLLGLNLCCITPIKAIAVTYDVDLLIISQNQQPTFIESFCTMPPHPDLREKLTREGKWERFIREFPSRPAGLDTPAPIKAPVTGVRKAIVLLVDFSDNEATTAQSQYVNLLFSLSTYPTGSMRDYYKEVSYNQLDVQGSVSGTGGPTPGWYRPPQSYSYYTNNNYGFGDYPRNAQRLTEDTVNLANPYVNFANYDNDSDGYVDALFIVHAGPGAEVTGNVNDIWSHKWVTSYVMYVDGVIVHSYSMEPEDGKIGVFSHELGHVFGLPDLYDEGYDSNGIGDWGLMAGGSWGGGGTRPVHPCAWSKITLGWVTPIVPTTNQNNVSFPAVETNQIIYKLWTNGAPANEYFLVENRQKVGFDGSLPGNGLLIWHIDDNKSTNNEQWYPSLPPANHYKVAVEPADGQWHLEKDINSGDTGDPFPGSTNDTAFDNTSTPDSKAYLTGTTNVGVINISISQATMTATLQINLSSLPGTFSLKSPEDGSTSIILTPTFIWGTTTAFYGGTVSYTLWYGTDSTFNTKASVTLSGNTFSTTLLDNSTYYWKVKAVDKYNVERWSNETNWKFYVNLFNESPGTPTLTEPPNNRVTCDLTPTFKWIGVSDPDPNDRVTYQLWYGKNSPTETRIKDITTTYYTPSSLLDNNSTYYWQVWAIDIVGSMTCSGTWTLKTGEAIVYPNPFYSKDKQITFTNLPDNSTIKIFTIAGELVKTLRGDNLSGEAKWHPESVASGIYLYVIESEGKVIKTGKLGILR